MGTTIGCVASRMCGSSRNVIIPQKQPTGSGPRPNEPGAQEGGNFWGVRTEPPFPQDLNHNFHSVVPPKKKTLKKNPEIYSRFCGAALASLHSVFEKSLALHEIPGELQLHRLALQRGEKSCQVVEVPNSYRV